ncbi:MAG: hypothetical protein BIFFINMI_02844 [Phycisphaerae bacterium]|nr:hypothetical protein [Phycisphaerae bacterium]
MRTIAVANQKGGCGKTTVSINLAACLANQGHRTLLVDADPQGHCAVGLGVPEAEVRHSVYHLLCPPDGDTIPLHEVVWQIAANLDLAPSNLELAKFETAMAARAGREKLLAEALTAAQGRYDFVIIDCPPSLSLLTFNALCAADEVLIPVEAGYFALHGLGRQLEVIESLQVLTGRRLGVRLVCNLYDIRTKAARKINNQLREHFGDLITHSAINLNTKLKSAAAVGQPITEFDRTSIGYHDFTALAREIAETPAAVEPLLADDTLLEQANSISRQAEQLLADSARLVSGSVADRIGGDPLRAIEGMTLEQKLEEFYGVRQMPTGTVFAVRAPEAESVFVAGDFNNWSPHAMPLDRDGSGRWAGATLLAPGTYRYRLVVDGQWMHDPHNDRREGNPFGELNSVFEVR